MSEKPAIECVLFQLKQRVLEYGILSLPLRSHHFLNALTVKGEGP